MFQQNPASNTNSEAMKQMGFGDLVHHLGVVGWIVLVTLAIMSVLSWYFIVANAIRNTMVRSRADRVMDEFWETDNPQEAVRRMEAQPKGEPFSKIALEAAMAVAHHQQQTTEGKTGIAGSLSRSEFIDRALRQGVARESLRLEGGLTILATVGSAAPFVGLLGTVWGIYDALIGIAAAGNASMEAVAGPVGEALIMTALGLFTAIPAVFAYNAYNRTNRVTFAQFDEFAHDLHDYFATGSRVEAQVRS